MAQTSITQEEEREPRDNSQSVYVILDTSDDNYYEKLRPLSRDLDKYSGYFIPRLNVEGTKCLIQIKVEAEKYKWVTISNIGVLGIGDWEWALEQMQTEEWTKPAYNEWQVHRDYLTSEIDEVEYENILEEGRASITDSVGG